MTSKKIKLLLDRFEPYLDRIINLLEEDAPKQPRPAVVFKLVDGAELVMFLDEIERVIKRDPGRTSIDTPGGSYNVEHSVEVVLFRMVEASRDTRPGLAFWGNSSHE